MTSIAICKQRHANKHFKQNFFFIICCWTRLLLFPAFILLQKRSMWPCKGSNKKTRPFSVPLLLPIFVFGLPFQLRPHSFTSGLNSSPEENLSKKCTFSDDRSFLNTTIIPLTVREKRLISTYLFFQPLKFIFSQFISIRNKKHVDTV